MAAVEDATAVFAVAARPALTFGFAVVAAAVVVDLKVHAVLAAD